MSRLYPPPQKKNIYLLNICTNWSRVRVVEIFSEQNLNKSLAKATLDFEMERVAPAKALLSPRKVGKGKEEKKWGGGVKNEESEGTWDR